MGQLLSAWRRAALTGVTALAFLVLLALPAMAHHRTGHAGGPPASTGAEVITEDNDSDGVANAPDPLGDSDNAHPSGKDKHAEAGGSGNQGNSGSEPDGNGKGPERDENGLDKPNGPGGGDILDQDGNNGCGNDDDFEDDNEGRCLGLGPATSIGEDKEEETTEETTEDVEETDVTVTEETTPVDVTETKVEASSQSAPAEGVLSEVTRPEPPQAAQAVPVVQADDAVLAFTGLDMGMLLLGLLALATLGWGTLAAGRRTARR